MKARYLLGLLLAGLSISARADPLVLREQGVVLTASPSADRVTFRFEAVEGWKIAAGYGIELSVPENEKTLWRERLPKTLEDNTISYFPGPVNMELHRRTVKPGTVNVLLGACFGTQLCTPITFAVKLK